MSALRCSECDAENPAGAKFCMSCGAPQGAPALSEERRKATVLFADLSGYTAIAERLDPEVTKGLVDHALGRLSREVVEHGGRVDKYIGDNVMAGVRRARGP